MSWSYDECGKFEEPERNVGVTHDAADGALLVFQLFVSVLWSQIKTQQMDRQTDRQTDRQRN